MQATIEKGLVEDKDIARSIKQEFDKNHGPTWHCIVGRHFGETTLQLKCCRLALSPLPYRRSRNMFLMIFVL